MRIAVCSRSFSRHPLLRDELLAHYPDTTFNDAGVSLAGAPLVDFLKGHDKAVIALEVIDAAVLDALPDLKVIAKYGVGFDKLDVAALCARGIRLGWTAGVNKRSVTELALCFMIALSRKLTECDRAIRQGNWGGAPGKLVSDRTVGIIGCGHVGQDITRLLRVMGAQVLVHDIEDRSAFCAETGAESCGIESLLVRADIVSLHVPYDATTRALLSKDRLASMKPGAVLINTARGGLVDEPALAALLQNGHLGGAAFDVFDVEPPENSPLVGLANFISTPHIGGGTEEAILAMGRAAIAGLDDNRVPEPGVFPK